MVKNVGVSNTFFLKKLIFYLCFIFINSIDILLQTISIFK